MSSMNYTTFHDEIGNKIKIPQYEVEQEDIAIKYFHQEFKNGERILDAWQRLDGWSGKGKENYKADFIKAILHGTNIPKIMEYTLKGDPSQRKRILDGGHRTRAIDEFMSAEFPVKLGENYYWWDKDDSRPSREGGGHDLILPRQLKDIFTKYKLTVTTYINLTDEQAREKFNDLNNCSPMKVHEVINSHSSLLIDHLRELWGDIVSDENSEEYAMIRELFSLSKADLESLKYMKVLVSLFSLVERQGQKDLFDYCQPTDALNYVRANDDACLNTQFDADTFEVEWVNFTDSMEKYQGWVEELPSLEVDGKDPYTWKPHNHSEALSVFHFMNSVNFTTDNDEKLIKFFKDCHDYRKDLSKIEKEIKKKVKENKDISELQEKLNELNTTMDDNVVDWMKTFKNNGSGPTNMLKRNTILTNVV